MTRFATGISLVLFMAAPALAQDERGERDLEALVETRRIDRYELRDREAVLYLDAPPAGETIRFALRARAETAGTASAPASEAFEYYRPTARGVFPPWSIEVKPRG